MRAAEVFNRSRLSRFLNRPAGRLFRFAAGVGFLTYGFTHRDKLSGRLALAWGPFPFTAGAFDVCYFSVMLGGPFSGAKVRAFQQSSFSPEAAGGIRTAPWASGSSFSERATDRLPPVSE